MKNFQDKKCLITGAASGIGRSTAIAMGKLGANLFLTDINPEGLKETVQIIINDGGKVSKYKSFDIAKYEDVKEFADEIHREHDSIDILMNIAGTSVWGTVDQLTHANWQKMIHVDLWGPIHGIECFIPQMIRAGKGGHLITVSSAAGLVAFPWHAAYSAAKWGIIGVSEVLRYDLMQHHINVSVVCPGAVDTPLKHTVEIVGIDKNHPEASKLIKRFTERAVTPDKVAQQIINGIKKNKFLIFTSFDIKFLYWSKRKIFPLYHLIMKKLNNLLNDVAKKIQKN
ncbi:MAG: SDR family oxidoreductase [Promethearchaeota archaeon]|nr:MAG: SDR family oxidoreductase [Candidatus Lokiarchaeota archaeon]